MVSDFLGRERLPVILQAEHSECALVCLAMVLNFLEQILLAGLIVRGLAGVVGLFGLGARALHTGNANTYAYWFLLGIAALWAAATGYLTF